MKKLVMFSMIVLLTASSVYAQKKNKKKPEVEPVKTEVVVEPEYVLTPFSLENASYMSEDNLKVSFFYVTDKVVLIKNDEKVEVLTDDSGNITYIDKRIYLYPTDQGRYVRTDGEFIWIRFLTDDTIGGKKSNPQPIELPFRLNGSNPESIFMLSSISPDLEGVLPSFKNDSTLIAIEKGFGTLLRARSRRMGGAIVGVDNSERLKETSSSESTTRPISIPKASAIPEPVQKTPSQLPPKKTTPFSPQQKTKEIKKEEEGEIPD